MALRDSPALKQRCITSVMSSSGNPAGAQLTDQRLL
jgi:hypothetical protein